MLQSRDKPLLWQRWLRNHVLTTYSLWSRTTPLAIRIEHTRWLLNEKILSVQLQYRILHNLLLMLHLLVLFLFADTNRFLVVFARWLVTSLHFNILSICRSLLGIIGAFIANIDICCCFYLVSLDILLDLSFQIFFSKRTFPQWRSTIRIGFGRTQIRLLLLSSVTLFDYNRIILGNSSFFDHPRCWWRLLLRCSWLLFLSWSLVAITR